MSVVSCQSSIAGAGVKLRLQRTTDHGPRAPRSGITLTEVLISMGILAIGLLGVAALFPVGGAFMMRAEEADNGSRIAQAVMNDLVTRGTVNPKAWYTWVPNASGTSPAHFTFPSDGKYSPLSGNAVRSSYTRPFAQALREAIASPTATPLNIERQFGSAYIIDPLFIALGAERAGDSNNVAVYGFPGSALQSYPRGGSWPYYKSALWDPWRTSGTERQWPIRRVTLQGADGLPMDEFTSANLQRIADDLVSDLPARADRPARQNYNLADVNSDNIPEPLSRQSTGDYSWIASVVPQTPEARNGMGTGASSYGYDVSVVVLKKRLLPRETATKAALTAGGSPQGQRATVQDERAVSASILSTGLNGGELLLTAMTDGIMVPGTTKPLDPFQNLRSGQWIMMCGPHPNSTAADPRFVLNWYQVMAIETEGVDNPKTQRIIVVRGPQWPWQPRGTYDNPNSDVAKLSDDLCVGILKGAIAVHSRTIKLEGTGDGLAIIAP